MRPIAIWAFSLAMVSLKAGSFASQLRIDDNPPVKADATIAWVAAGDDSWQKLPPTFTLPEAVTGVSAKGWLVTTDTELRLRVDVHKKTNINTQTGAAIWNGDFLRIGIDGKGDGSAGGAADATGIFGPDDASIGFALTPTGPQGWVYSAGDKQNLGTYAAELLKIVRDEATSTTRYDIHLPWNRLHIQPGLFPIFGMAVQVRSIDVPYQREPVQIRWGAGVDGPQLGLYRKVAVTNPPHELIGTAPSANQIWDPGDRGAIAVAVASANPVTIHASAGGQTLEWSLPGDAGLNVRRFLVTWDPSQPADNTLQASVTKTGQGQPTTRASNEMFIATAPFQQLCDRLDQLIPQAKHPLFLRHLRSVKAMVQAEWARAIVYRRTNPALAQETIGYL